MPLCGDGPRNVLSVHFNRKAKWLLLGTPPALDLPPSELNGVRIASAFRGKSGLKRSGV